MFFRAGHSRSQIKLAMLLASFVPTFIGCDHNDEPVPSPDRPAAQQKAQNTSKSPATRTSNRTRRCIKDTPAEPVRHVLGAIPDPACPADPGPAPNLARRNITVASATGERVVEVEVASHADDRARGLMYRTAMADNNGMLFEFEEEQMLTFWMHNTCLPLDMIFIAADGTIVGIEENTPTMSDETFSPGCPSRYVLEMNAGWARKNGVRAGMHVKL